MRQLSKLSSSIRKNASNFLKRSPIRITKNYRYGVGLNRRVVVRSFSALVGVSLLASTFFGGSASASFSDDFNRSDSGTVGNGWVETESTGAIGISGNKLFFDQTDDLANRPMVEKTFTNYSSGILEWIYTMDWNNNGEGTLAMYMQIGDSGSWTDPVTNQHTGIAASLRWSGVGCSASGECLAYRNDTPAYVDIQTVNTATEIKVTLDLDNDTFSIDVGNNGSEEVSDEGFTNGAQDIDAVRFFTDGLNDANVLGRTFDDVSVQPEGSTSSAPMLSQSGFIWENDDGSSADTNTQLAAGDTALSGVIAGSRLNLRTQIENTGGALDADTDLGLFYDRGDGIWSRVDKPVPPIVSNGNCTDNDFNCSAVDSSGSVGFNSEVAIDSSGRAWVVHWDESNSELEVSIYVGSGGNCSNDAWSCTTVDSNAASVGTDGSIAFDNAGNPWISYRDITNGDLRVANYVGSGGNCTDSSWDCTTVNAGGSSGWYSSIAFDSNGTAWVAHFEGDNGDLRVARYVGSGGNCTDSAWQCSTVDSNSNSGYYASLAIDSEDNPWISYHDFTNSTLRVARYVGSGGNCTDSSWECTTVDSSADVGSHSSIAFDAAGNAWISHLNFDTLDLEVAQYVGTGGNCTSSAWNCSVVQSTGSSGWYTSIAFDPSGAAWIAHHENGSNNLELARYVGSGGDCSNTAWECHTIDSSADVGEDTSIAFDQSGTPWITYRDNTSDDLKIATTNRGGEILVAPAVSINSGAVLSESHADMSTVNDTANRDDSDCIGGGAWTNGTFSAYSKNSVSIPEGTSTAQCTEVSWTVDTTNAQQATTYRFVVASLDSTIAGTWRGPVQTDEYPTLTIGSTAASTVMAAKQSEYSISNTACTGADDSDWRCDVLHANDIGVFTPHALTISPEGTPWIVEGRQSTSPTSYLQVAEYAGEGNGDCSDNDAWECTTIETRNIARHFYHPTLSFDDAGTPWIAYFDDTGGSVFDLKVARYVGSGGNCSGSSEWQCEVVMANTGGSERGTLAIDNNGVPWISYDLEGSPEGLGIARYVGAGGTGCTSGAWKCEVVIQGSSEVNVNELVFDHNNNAWVTYYKTSSNDLAVARYVGAGGSGCNLDSWNCEIIESTGDVGIQPTIAIDQSNTAWIAYRDQTENDFMVAQYVGDGSGSGCTASTDWTCTEVNSNSQFGSNFSTIAFDVNDNPWVVTHDSNGSVDGLVIARHVGSGGSCSNTDWECETIEDTADDTGRFARIAFDNSGTPWLSYFNVNTTDLQVAKLIQPKTPPLLDTVNFYNGRSAYTGLGQYRLTDGRSPITSDLGTCSATTGETGYCGIHQPDGVLETLASDTNARPTYTYALKTDQNSTAPFSRVHFQTSGSPATYPVRFEIYRFGSTNDWEALSSRTTAGCSTDNCVLEGTPSGTASEYFDSDGSDYWVYVRVYQEQNSAGSLNFNIDGLHVVPQREWLRHGQTINEFRTNGVFGW